MGDFSGGLKQGIEPLVEQYTIPGPTVDPKHNIFLSHSGAQKNFAEQLCVELERAHYFPFFDKRDDSLKKGEEFPEVIIKAARQCQVAIVVISEDYFTRRKWPMIELAEFVDSKRSNSNIKILPLFYLLTSDECSDLENHKRWFKTWQHWASSDPRINVCKWEKALRILGRTNGLQYVPAKGEVVYREEIVAAVCKLIRPAIRWDDSHVQGRSRLCEAVLKKFQEVEPSQIYGVRVVGLYGMGGTGKTTACKSMCNEMYAKFCGRVCHAELTNNQHPFDLQKHVLQELTHVRLEALESISREEDKGRTLLIERMKMQKVFLALDNVWDTDTSLEKARAYLRVGFQQGSMVMVTSRTSHTLSLLQIDERQCMEIPKLERGDAEKLFLYHVSQCSGTQFELQEKTNIIKDCARHCYFSSGLNFKDGFYLPLALKVFGGQLGATSHDPSKWVESLRKLDIVLSQKEKHPIFSILKTSYDSLPIRDKMMFLDIVLFRPRRPHIEKHFNIMDWLSVVHDMDVSDIIIRMEALKTRSLIEGWNDECTRVYVHDLYRDLAKSESSSIEVDDGAFVNQLGLNVKGNISAPDLALKTDKSPYLRRMCITSSNLRSLKKVRMEHVRVLKLLRCKELQELSSQQLESLKSLNVNSCPRLGGAFRGFEKLQELAWLSQDAVCTLLPFETPITSLQVLILEQCPKRCHVLFPPNLEGCVYLRKLELVGFTKMQALPDLSNLVNLQIVRFKNCWQAKHLKGLSSKLSYLQVLNLEGCRRLLEIPGLSESSALEELNLGRCDKLQHSSGMQTLTKLQSLDIAEWRPVNFPVIRDLFQLRRLNCRRCPGYTSFCVLPDLSTLRNLQELILRESNVTKVDSIDYLTSLRKLDLSSCTSLNEVPDLSDLKELEDLNLSQTGIVVFPMHFSRLVALQYYCITKCKGLIQPLFEVLLQGPSLQEIRTAADEVLVHDDVTMTGFCGGPYLLGVKNLHQVAHYEQLLQLVSSTVDSESRRCYSKILSAMCWQNGTNTEGAEMIGRIDGGVDTVIRVLCDDRGGGGHLSYVVAALAATGKHWDVLRAPSTLQALAMRIVQFLVREVRPDNHICYPIIEGVLYPKGIKAIHGALLVLTGDTDVGRALANHGASTVLQGLLYLNFYIINGPYPRKAHASEKYQAEVVAMSKLLGVELSDPRIPPLKLEVMGVEVDPKGILQIWHPKVYGD